MTDQVKAKKMSVAIMKALEDYLPVENCGSFYSDHIILIILTYLRMK